MIYLKNIREKQTVYIPRTEINGKVVAVKSYDEGYADGIVEGKKLQKLKLTNLTVSENGVYKREDGWNEVEVDVPDIPSKTQQKTLYVTKNTDVVLPDEGYDGLSQVNINATQYGQDKRNEGYTDGYTTGKADGTEEGYQSGKQDGIEEGYQNGYNTGKEDGTEEGYAQGKTDGYTEGYEDGIAEGGKIDVDDTQVMNITANGTYTTQYTKSEDVGRVITGYFDDNTPFYGYAHLTNHTIATGLIATKTSKVELWWRPDFNGSGSIQYIFASSSPIFGGFYLKVDGGKFNVKFGNYTKNNLLEVEDKWYHIAVSADGLVIDGERITTLGTPSMLMAGNNMFINGDGTASNPLCANGYFGMVKIDGKTFIPTEDGFIDYATDTILRVSKKGDYDYENPTYEGNLIRTVHVNVPQNTLKTQNKILTVTKDLEVVYPDSGYNALAEVSVDATQYGQEKQNEGYTEGHLQGKTEGYENGKTDGYTEGKTDGYAEGYEVGKAEGENTPTKINMEEYNLKFMYSTITEVPEWADWSGITSMSNMFNCCYDLKKLPSIDTSNVTNMSYMCYYCRSLTSIEPLDIRNVEEMEYMFYACDIKTAPLLNSTITAANSAKFMFYNCQLLESIPALNLSNVKSAESMFHGCEKITEIPSLNLTSVTSTSHIFYGCRRLQSVAPMNTSNVTDMESMFYDCFDIREIPELDVTNVVNMDYFFAPTQLTYFSNFGGFKNLKRSFTGNYGLKNALNLSYESCINVLNGLYDFTGNNQTPTSSQGKLQVHQNFLDKVGEQISIATNKGWTITA